MKLASRYNRINVSVTLAVFLIASAAFYTQLKRILIHQLDEDLEIEMEQLEAYVAYHGYLPKAGLVVPDQMTHYERVAVPQGRVHFRTTALLDEAEGHSNLFREILFPLQIGAARYQVTISKSLEATGALMRAILLTAAATVLLMLGVVVLLNRIVLRRLWAPFYASLQALKGYKVGVAAPALPATRISEFSLMNQTLEAVTGNASQDYRVLKEFTENASHELQTPLAIIRSKLDLIIQDESLTGNQSIHIASAYDAVQRLAHLNTSLLLLARLEGGQFGRTAVQMDIKKELETKLEAFTPHLREAGLFVQTNLAAARWTTDPILSDALLNNLLSNAIHHNRAGGRIRIELTKGKLVVSNTSGSPALEEAGLFSRFYKADAESTRTGLGLAIVKQICAVSGFDITYLFADAEHTFTMRWREA